MDSRIKIFPRFLAGKQKLSKEEILKVYFDESQNFLVIDGTGKVILYQEEEGEKGREKGKQYELLSKDTI